MKEFRIVENVYRDRVLINPDNFPEAGANVTSIILADS